MKKNTKILIIVCAAALILAGLMCLLIFLPKGDGSSSGAATYDEGVKMSVTTDKDGVHQAQIQTNDKGEIDNNSYGTLMDYIPAKISRFILKTKRVLWTSSHIHRPIKTAKQVLHSTLLYVMKILTFRAVLPTISQTMPQALTLQRL